MPSYLHTTSDSTQEPYKLAYKNEIEISISDIFGFMTNQELLYHKLRETDPQIRRLIAEEIEIRPGSSLEYRRLNSADFIRYILKNREEKYYWDDFMNP